MHTRTADRPHDTPTPPPESPLGMAFTKLLAGLETERRCLAAIAERELKAAS